MINTLLGVVNDVVAVFLAAGDELIVADLLADVADQAAPAEEMLAAHGIAVLDVLGCEADLAYGDGVLHLGYARFLVFFEVIDGLEWLWKHYLIRAIKCGLRYINLIEHGFNLVLYRDLQADIKSRKIFANRLLFYSKHEATLVINLKSHLEWLIKY